MPRFCVSQIVIVQEGEAGSSDHSVLTVNTVIYLQHKTFHHNLQLLRKSFPKTCVCI